MYFRNGLISLQLWTTRSLLARDRDCQYKIWFRYLGMYSLWAQLEFLLSFAPLLLSKKSFGEKSCLRSKWLDREQLLREDFPSTKTSATRQWKAAGHNTWSVHQIFLLHWLGQSHCSLSNSKNGDSFVFLFQLSSPDQHASQKSGALCMFIIVILYFLRLLCVYKLD